MNKFFFVAPLRWLMVATIVFSTLTTVLAQRQMERLGRGFIAMRNTSTQVYVGWRLLGNDPGDIGFNLYRAANGGAAVKLNTLPLTNTTDYVDTPANLTTTAYTYSLKPVLNGVEVTDIWANPLSPPSATVPANATAQASLYVRVPLQPTPDGALDVKFCWVGDLDGDGEYDFVVDRQPAGETRQFLEAYKRDGTLLWRMDMGYNSTNHYNITPGSSTVSIGHGDNVTVYDLDGDGKAEVIVRTAKGVIFADGSMVGGTDDRVQYVSVLDGMTGVEKARITIPNPWLSIGQMNGHMGILYCDGVRPSIFWQSSVRRPDLGFNEIASTWDYRNGALSLRWTRLFDTLTHQAAGHQIRFGDPDNDGKDEYLDVGHGLDDDGTELYGIDEVIHGDRFHIGDLDPDRPGMETFVIQQNNASSLATAYYDSATGKIIKKWYAGGVVDVGRGDATDFDPSHKGSELVSTQPGIFDAMGNQIYSAGFFPAEAIWWDSDLSREFLQSSETVRISKVVNGGLGYFDLIDKNTDAPGVYQANGGRPAFWGDILGDWREELLVVENGNTALRIYTTDYAATNRLYTLMHNPQYRDDTTTKGYVQASMVDYYLGTGMTPPPPPPMVQTKLTWRGNVSSVWDGSTANWFTNGLWISNNVPVNYTSGDSVLFDLTGSNSAAIALTGTLTPGDVAVYSPKNYTFDGSAGSLSGAMKLAKVGKGTLTLSGSNDFTGQTTVWDGALIVNGDLQASPVTVWGGTWGGPLAAGLTGGRIGGTGRFSQPVTIRYRGAISPGAGVTNAGTLSFGSGLKMEDGTTFAMDLSDDSTGTIKTNDLINITGNLTLQGINTFAINRLNATLPPGVYPLINYTGSLIGGVGGLKLSGLAGIPATFSNSPGQISLVVKSVRPPMTVTWTGGKNGNTWDQAISSNWVSGVTKDVFVPQDSVRFDDTGASNLTVNLTDSLLTANVIVDSTANYNLGGSGAITGSGSLVKSNTSTLTITAINNNFTGRTLLAGGTLVVSELDAVGFPSPLGNAGASPTNLVMSGSPTLRVTGESYTDRGLTLNAGTNSLEVFNAADQVTIANNVIGGGALQKLGPGTLALTASNSYSGGTFIQGGSIVLGGVNGAGNRYGVGTGLITFLNGTLSLLDLQASYGYGYSFFVPPGGVGRLDCDGRSTMTGSLTNYGTFTVMTPFIRTDFNGNWSSSTGQLNIISDADGGSFRLNNAAGLPNARVNVGNLVSFQSRLAPTPTVSIGELSGAQGANLYGGTGSDGLAVNWSVGGLNTSATFAGSTYNNVGLIKVGTGTWTLSGTNISHTGQTTVNGGTLLINGNAATASGLVTVGAAGTLGGSGIVGGTTTVNGKLSPGTSIGTLTFSNNLTLGAGSTAFMEINKSSSTCDLALVRTTLTYNGTLVVTNLSGTLAAGNSFKIFDAATYAGSFSTLNLPPLGGGLMWDTTNLKTSGTISVAVSLTGPPSGAPGNLIATAASYSQINLTWTDNSTNESNFIIESSTNNVSFAQVGSVGLNVTSFSHTGLAASTTYYYRVRASNGTGDSTNSSVASATTFVQPSGPGEIVKANNANNLDQGTSWTNGSAPLAANIAVWNSLVTSASTTLLGTDASWSGIRIANPAGLVTISAGNTLTLGASGIDMSGAAQSLTLNNAVTLNSAQTWNVANGRALTLTGAFAAGSGNALTKAGPGLVAITPLILAAAAPDGLIVHEGTLRLSGAGSTLPVKLDGGTYDLGAALSTPVDVSTNGGTILVTANRTLSAPVTGTDGTLNLSLSSQMSFGADVFAGFSGTVALGGSTSGTRPNSSAFAGNNNVVFDLGTNKGYMNCQSSAGTVALGALAGGPATALGVNVGSVIWSIGGKNIDSEFDGTISGAASIIKVGTGSLVLTGTNGYSGTTTISNGVLQIGNGGTTGTVGTNSIVNRTTLAFNRSDTVTYDGAISGPGHLAQIGDGTLLLSGIHAYTGPTTIESGTLALTNAASIATSPSIDIAVGATLDVSGHNGGGLTLASGQTLSGRGSVNGNLTVASGAKLAPGNSIGTMTFNNSLTLAPGSTTTLEIAKSPNGNDTLNVQGSLTYGGTLLVTNVSGYALAAADSFNLFTGTPPAGLFNTLILPPLGANLVWDTNTFNLTGTLTVLSTAPPVFGSVAPRSDGNFRLTFSGPFGQDYELRATTNMALRPITLWDLVDSDTFGTNVVIYDDLSATNYPQRFYQIRVLIP